MKFRYGYPYNARTQEQLDVMVRLEKENIDALDVEQIKKEQEVAFTTNHWCVSRNRFPYAGSKQHWLISAVEPIYYFTDMSEEMWQDLFAVWQKLAFQYGIKGGGLVFRFGDAAASGASLNRVHCHIVEPMMGEKVSPTIGGRETLREGLELAED